MTLLLPVALEQSGTGHSVPVASFATGHSHVIKIMIMCDVGKDPHKGCLPCEDAQQQHASATVTWTEELQTGAQQSTQLSYKQYANGSAHATGNKNPLLRHATTGVGGTSKSTIRGQRFTSIHWVANGLRCSEVKLMTKLNRICVSP